MSTSRIQSLLHADPSICLLQGACELPNGDLLLVTEFMEGGDLHSALRRGAVSWRRRCAKHRLCCVGFTCKCFVMHPACQQWLRDWRCRSGCCQTTM